MKNDFDLSGKKNVNRDESFWLKVDRNSKEDCWEWKGSLNRGYGQFWVGHTFIGAHKYSYELHFGKIENGLLVCHRCDNRKCVNPNHLFLGTYQDNENDKVSKNRQAKGKKNGQSGTRNWKNKLSELDVIEIRKKLEDKTPYKVLSQKYGVTEGMIYYIKSRRSWSWL